MTPWLHTRFIASDAAIVDDDYYAALAADEDLGRTRGIDATLKKFNLDAILLPTDGDIFYCSLSAVLLTFFFQDLHANQQQLQDIPLVASFRSST